MMSTESPGVGGVLAASIERGRPDKRRTRAKREMILELPRDFPRVVPWKGFKKFNWVSRQWVTKIFRFWRRVKPPWLSKTSILAIYMPLARPVASHKHWSDPGE